MQLYSFLRSSKKNTIILVSLTLLQSFNWFKHQIKPRFAIFFFSSPSISSFSFYYLTTIVNGNVLYCVFFWNTSLSTCHISWHKYGKIVLNDDIYYAASFAIFSQLLFQRIHIIFWWNCHTPNCTRAHFVRCFPSDYHCEFVSITLLNHKNKIIFHCLDEVCHFRIKYHQRNFIYYNWIRCFYSIEMSFYVQ